MIFSMKMSEKIINYQFSMINEFSSFNFQIDH